MSSACKQSAGWKTTAAPAIHMVSMLFSGVCIISIVCSFDLVMLFLKNQCQVHVDLIRERVWQCVKL